MQKIKKIRDPIHGIIELDNLALMIIDTFEFQRLKDISQLGFSKYVYPGCTHTRFEHSIGTYHLMKRLISHFTEQDSEENSIDPKNLSNSEAYALRIAALCHDLGHGPFSHSWERFIHEGGAKYSSYSHEKMSCVILTRLLNKNKTINLEFQRLKIDLNLIRALITSEISTIFLEKYRTRKFIFEILSNNLNGIDVDKWDYLCRDAYFSGISHLPVQIDRWIDFYRPKLAKLKSDDDDTYHMAFRSSESQAIFQCLSLRQQLHQILYQHKTSLALDAMFFDALEIIEPHLGLRDLCLQALENPESDALNKFLNIQQNYFWRPQFIHYEIFAVMPDVKVEQYLKDSRQHMNRIYERNIYRCCGSIFLTHKSQHISSHLKLMLPRCNYFLFENESDLEKYKLLLLKSLGQVNSETDNFRIIFGQYRTSSTKKDPILIYYDKDLESCIQDVPLEETKILFLFWAGQTSPSEEDLLVYNKLLMKCASESFKKINS